MAWTAASEPARSVDTIQTGNGVIVRADANDTGDGVNIGNRTYQVWEVASAPAFLNPAGTPVTSSVLATSLTLTWTAPANVEASRGTITYQPQISVSPFTTYTNNGATTTSLTRGVTGLTTATAYRFRIKATDANGNVSYSAHVAQTTA